LATPNGGNVRILAHRRLVCAITTSNVGGSDFLVLKNSICDAQWWKVGNFGASPTSLHNYDAKCGQFGFLVLKKYNSIGDAQWWKRANSGASPTSLRNYDVKCRRFGFFGVEKFYLRRPMVESREFWRITD
jgi:hypothetical protein